MLKFSLEINKQDMKTQLIKQWEKMKKKTKLFQKLRINYKLSTYPPTQALGENQRLSSENHELNRSLSKKTWY